MKDQLLVVRCHINHEGLGSILVSQRLKFCIATFNFSNTYNSPIYSTDRHSGRNQKYYPCSVFYVCFTEDFFNLIMDQCNLYTQQYITKNPSSVYARPLKWKPITVQEFKVFLSLTLNMGLTKN